MKKFLLALSALAITATSAFAWTGPVCYPTSGPRPGELRSGQALPVSVPPSTCRSGTLILIGGLNNGPVVIKQRTCHCG